MCIESTIIVSEHSNTDVHTHASHTATVVCSFITSYFAKKGNAQVTDATAMYCGVHVCVCVCVSSKSAA